MNESLVEQIMCREALQWKVQYNEGVVQMDGGNYRTLTGFILRSYTVPFLPTSCPDGTPLGPLIRFPFLSHSLSTVATPYIVFLNSIHTRRLRTVVSTHRISPQ